MIYSVEPYQNVRGCHVGAPSPNGLVIDSTMSVLSHEFSESITDPDGTRGGTVTVWTFTAMKLATFARTQRSFTRL